MKVKDILKNHKSIRAWFIVTIVFGSVVLFAFLFCAFWEMFKLGVADIGFFTIGFFVAINAIGVCIALLNFAVTIDKAKLAGMYTDGNQTVATKKVRRNDFDTISYRLDKLFELKENGVITEEEFVEQKKIILGE